jgi:GntR family transcriptional regulator/MocR family aminotransferase
VEPGSTVAVEEPGYPPARQLFASQGANVVGIPVDAEGIVVGAIPSDCRLIYVTPSHQFPLGMQMSLRRRKELLARALAMGAIVVEDDYDSAFLYKARPVDSLQSMDAHGIVAYVGTFSKVMMPELRIGYLVAPPAILQAVSTAKHLSDWHGSTLMQQALANFIADGHLQKHIRRCHNIYAARRDAILRRLHGDLSPWLEPVPIEAGFHMTALLRRAVDVPLLLRMARRMDVGLYSTAGFHADTPPAPALFFGFGAIDTLDIDEALNRVRQVLEELA